MKSLFFFSFRDFRVQTTNEEMEDGAPERTPSVEEALETTEADMKKDVAKMEAAVKEEDEEAAVTAKMAVMSVATPIKSATVPVFIAGTGVSDHTQNPSHPNNHPTAKCE